MMDWTDRHCRALHRSLTRHARLYTEMVTTAAVLRGDPARLLAFSPAEHPLALQIGGSEPGDCAAAARIAQDMGYDEVNLNVGCPSDRVQSGRFGACLMREPERVAECMAAMGAAVRIPTTVKCRIGVDDQDPQESLFRLVELCAGAGVRVFAVHARKAWLEGLSPKENRDIPPLDYGLVHRLKAARPELTIILNGGLQTLEEAQEHIAAGLDGVMIGRAAYHDPGMLGRADRLLYDAGAEEITPEAAVGAYRPYVRGELGRGAPFYAMARHMLGLFHGRPGARAWRRVLTEEGAKPGAGLEVLDRALEQVHDRTAPAPALAAAL